MGGCARRSVGSPAFQRTRLRKWVVHSPRITLSSGRITRVEAVGEHYRRFLERFPTVGALAAADEDAVLTAS